MKGELRDRKSDSKGSHTGLVGVSEGYTEITEKSVPEDLTARNFTELK